MSRLERIAVSLIVLAGLVVLGALGVRWYGASQYRAGQEHALAISIAAAKAAIERQAAAARKTESDLRAQLRAKDAHAFQKEQDYAESLEAAQRRVRAGTDRLRCPIGPVPAAAAPDDRPLAGGPGADGEGPTIVPEAAADLLGVGANVAGLVRRYERVVERFEACRAVNALP